MKKFTSRLPRGFVALRALLFLLLSLAGIALGVLAFSPALAQQQQQPPSADPEAPRGINRGLVPVVQFDISPPLRELALTEPTVKEPEGERDDDPRVDFDGPLGPQDVDAEVQGETGTGEIAAPTRSFDAFNGTDGISPPDPVAAVGLDHVVVMANVRYAIYNKAGALLVGPANSNTLWSGFGGACQNENAGDPIVFYDRRADRFILTQFTSVGPNFFNCMAISQTSDPTGSYYRYAISTGSNFPDYPKYGTWSNAYLISTREFTDATASGTYLGVGAYALNRAQMLAGNASPQILSFFVPLGSTPYRIGSGLLPADVDSWTPPPAGSPAYFIGTQDNGSTSGAPNDAINIWNFIIDFASPGNASFTLANILPSGSFDSLFPCAPEGRDCIPQGGTTQKVDHQGSRQRPLFRAAYRNFGTHESIVTNQSVDVSGISGIRWWEIRNPGTAPTIFQQSTYAPGVSDDIHRWMGSIAMDGLGNIALGYSASSSSMFPAIRYTGRYATSALNSMPLGEGVIINGTGSQTGSPRWGDYTSMVVDPVDDTTFWYVNQYYPVSSGSGWRLRMGSFRLVNLAAGATSITSESCSPANSAPDPGETVTMNFCVRNTSATSTGNIVGTLLNGDAVANAGAAQTYGVLAPGATLCRPFTFTANGSCGQVRQATVQFQAGTEDLGRQSYDIALGFATVVKQDFDGVTAPALPTGWLATQGANPGGVSGWTTSNSADPAPPAESFPNSAFAPDPFTVLDNRLTSPSFTYAAGAVLTFRHSYVLLQQSSTVALSAAVLEISVNNGPYTDILNAGGVFAAGGYDHSSIGGTTNPLLPSRPNWSGNSDGFVSTVVDLPNFAAGQPVRLRWRLGTGTNLLRTVRGWHVDDVFVGNYACCGNAPAVTAAVSRKTHSGAGTYNVSLPLTGAPGVEPRSGGATGDHSVIVTFAAPVSVRGLPQAQLIAGDGVIGALGSANAGSVSVIGSSVFVSLTNVPNAQALTLRLNSVNGTGDVTIPLGILLGDTTGNGFVNATDIGQIKGQAGQPPNAGNFRADVNANGAINATDISLAKSVSGTQLP